MINRLMGFVSLESRLLNHWHLSLTGLLLLGGLAATASTFKVVTPKPSNQAINSVSVAPPFFDAVVPRQSDKAVDSSTVTLPSKTTEPQQVAQSINSATVAPPAKTVKVQQPDQNLNSTGVVPPSATTAPQPSDQAVDSTSVTSPLTASLPQSEDKTTDATSVASASGEVEPQKLNKAVGSPLIKAPLTKLNRRAQGSKTTIAQTPNSIASIPDGVYLYGQSSEPQQVGKEYIVFEAHQGKVAGALYLPSSEFSCFQGTLDSKQLNLTVVNPYDQSAFSHTIARQQSTQVAAAGSQINLDNAADSLTYPYAVKLEGYQQIRKISDSDRQLLSQCQNMPQKPTNNQ